MDGPEAREGYHSGNDGPCGTFDEEGKDAEYDAGQSECPPAFLADMIFRLYYNRMEYADYQETGDSYYDAFKIYHVLCRFKRGFIV